MTNSGKLEKKVNTQNRETDQRMDETYTVYVKHVIAVQYNRIDNGKTMYL